MAERFRDVQFLADHLAAAKQWVADCAADSLEEWADYIIFNESDYTPAFGSPLEAVFYVWWQTFVEGSMYKSRLLDLRDQVDVEVEGERFRVDFEMAPTQHLRERLTQTGLSWTRLAVELDGHTFHEKTLEQVTYRNRRDRLLQSAGWHVFHLSYDEVNRAGGADACVEVMASAVQRAAKLDADAWTLLCEAKKRAAVLSS